MTPEAQRIAIAEACGWTHIKNFHTMKIKGMWLGYPPVNPIINNPNEIPDYLNDLNAMHEAEKVIFEKDAIWSRYCEDLFIHSTASQRAEEFLKTLGLLKDK